MKEHRTTTAETHYLDPCDPVHPDESGLWSLKAQHAIDLPSGGSSGFSGSPGRIRFIWTWEREAADSDMAVKALEWLQERVRRSERVIDQDRRAVDDHLSLLSGRVEAIEQHLGISKRVSDSIDRLARMEDRVAELLRWMDGQRKEPEKPAPRAGKLECIETQCPSRIRPRNKKAGEPGAG